MKSLNEILQSWLNKASDEQLNWICIKLNGQNFCAETTDQQKEFIVKQITRHPDSDENRERLKNLMQAWRQQKHLNKQKLSNRRYYKFNLSNSDRTTLEWLAKRHRRTLSAELSEMIKISQDVESEIQRRVKEHTDAIEEKIRQAKNRPTQAGYNKLKENNALLVDTQERLKEMLSRDISRLCYLQTLVEKVGLEEAVLSPEDDEAYEQKMSSKIAEIDQITSFANFIAKSPLHRRS